MFMLRPTFKVAVLATAFLLLFALALDVVAPHPGGGQTSVQGAISQSIDPLQAPNIIDFRRSEHAEAGNAVEAADPLTAPNIIDFRRSEHAEASGD